MRSLKHILMYGKNLHFGLIMHYGGKCSAHRTWEGDACSESMAALHVPPSHLLGTGATRRYLWDAAWDTAFWLAQTNMLRGL